MENHGRYQIRHYSHDDLPAVLHVYKRAIYKIGGRYYSHEQVDAWAATSLDLHAWEQRLNSGVVLVATDAGHLAGFIRFEPTGKVDLLYVHPNHERHGIAKALHHKIERLARQERVPRLFTQASEAARLFFEGQGYTLIGIQDVDRHGVKLVNYRMEKKLGEL
jgi:putative acetyltransferase